MSWEHHQNSVKIKETAALLVLSLAIVMFSMGFPFFWDNVVQLSIPAHYYFNTNFSTLFLPDDIATGHQTFIGMYLAAGWKLFGKNLTVSHLLMLPVVFGCLYQLWRLIIFYFPNQLRQIPVFIICFLESAFLSQMSLITFEIFHIFFFLGTLNGIIRKKNGQTMLFFSLLMLVSLRATMSGFGIIIFVFLDQIFVQKKFNLKKFLVFLPGLTLFGLFLLTFYLQKGWIIHNTVSKNWSGAAAYADFAGMFRNTVIFLWRLVDFGKIIYWIIFSFIIYQIYRRKIYDKRFTQLLLIASGQFLIFFITVVPYQNSIAHRYLLPITLIFGIAVMYWILHYYGHCRSLMVWIFAYIISGYFWVYPDRTAKGWDSMPAHWSYFPARNDMMNYLKQHNISYHKVATYFPNTGPLDKIEVNSDVREPARYAKDADYFLYSNVFNVNDKTLNDLSNRNQFEAVHKINHGFVEIILFKKK